MKNDSLPEKIFMTIAFMMFWLMLLNTKEVKEKGVIKATKDSLDYIWEGKE